MRIAVLGASGRTGKMFVQTALQQGHIVYAGIHHTNNLPTHKNLLVQTCDATNANQILQLISGTDCVVSLLGHAAKSTSGMQTQAMRTLVSELNNKGIPIVSLTGTGVRVAGDKVRLLDYVVTFLLTLLSRKRVDDGINHYRVLLNSDTPWTVLRVLKISDGAVQSYILTKHGPPRFFVSRATICSAIMEILQTDVYQKSAPIISK